jgi:CMP-N,N'-diacetyllegionaminic acid synthase
MLPEKATFCFDLDGVIATIVPNNDYTLAAPIAETVSLINRLFDAGHTIILHTARGSLTGIDWRSVTIQQLDAWGVRYHKVQFGKPAADFYIDDKLISVADLSALAAAVSERAGTPPTR